MERFAKIITQRTFQLQAPKLFPKKPALKRFLIFSRKKAFLIVSQKKTPVRSGLSPQKHALKKFLIFSQKSLQFSGNGNPYISQETELSYISGDRIFLYFRKGKFLILPEKKLSYTSGNRTFFFFLERYIQNPSIFRTRSTFRTLTNLELQDYSEP